MTVQSASATTGGFACSFAGRVVTCTGGSLANGQSATITVVVKDMPPTPEHPCGLMDYYMPRHTAVVDPANQIAERDESNNWFSQQFFNPNCIQ
jgi:hypothetical protein